MDRIAIHHIGIAVDDLDSAIAIYGSLFTGSVEHRDVVPDQGVEAASIRIGPSRIELLCPLSAETPVGRFIAGRGPGLHHVAFEVSDLRSELARLQTDGVELIDEEPRLGLFGLQVAFIHPQATGGVLAELVSNGRN